MEAGRRARTRALILILVVLLSLGKIGDDVVCLAEQVCISRSQAFYTQ
jgi:hypothetical protein